MTYRSECTGLAHTNHLMKSELPTMNDAGVTVFGQPSLIKHNPATQYLRSLDFIMFLTLKTIFYITVHPLFYHTKVQFLKAYRCLRHKNHQLP